VQVTDHRSIVAEKKRVMMRARLLDAAMRVFADDSKPSPVIDDVIREANVSRGTFYNYFDSLDQVLAAVGQTFNDEMVTGVLPVYDVLGEPWQRASVGFRVFLLRALVDAKWAGFLVRIDAWPQTTVVATYMGADLENGRAKGQFSFDDARVAADFLVGAKVRAIQAIRQGLDDPNAYMNAAVRMALASIGCSRELADRGVAFSTNYLHDWVTGAIDGPKPDWALNLRSDQGRFYAAPGDAFREGSLVAANSSRSNDDDSSGIGSPGACVPGGVEWR
jgi:AcrR family transcriptional regulator